MSSVMVSPWEVASGVSPRRACLWLVLDQCDEAVNEVLERLEVVLGVERGLDQRVVVLVRGHDGVEIGAECGDRVSGIVVDALPRHGVGNLRLGHRGEDADFVLDAGAEQGDRVVRGDCVHGVLLGDLIGGFSPLLYLQCSTLGSAVANPLLEHETPTASCTHPPTSGGLSAAA